MILQRAAPPPRRIARSLPPGAARYDPDTSLCGLDPGSGCPVPCAPAMYTYMYDETIAGGMVSRARTVYFVMCMCGKHENNDVKDDFS